MKCQAETDFAYVKAVDLANDADAANPICSYTTGASVICNQYGQKNATIIKDWTYFKVSLRRDAARLGRQWHDHLDRAECVTAHRVPNPGEHQVHP